MLRIGISSFPHYKCFTSTLNIGAGCLSVLFNEISLQPLLISPHFIYFVDLNHLLRLSFVAPRKRLWIKMFSKKSADRIPKESLPRFHVSHLPKIGSSNVGFQGINLQFIAFFLIIDQLIPYCKVE